MRKLVQQILLLFASSALAQSPAGGGGLAVLTSIGWYEPSFSYYNEQYASLDDVPFTNDVANSYVIPEIGGSREYTIGARWRFRTLPQLALGVNVSTMDAGVRTLLDNPPKPGEQDHPLYSHEISLTPVFLSLYYHAPLSNLAQIYFGQGVGLVWVKETVNITAEDGATVFEDGSNSTGLLFQPLIGLQHKFAGESFVFAEAQYVLGGYSSQGWTQPRDPFKSTFIRRGSVSLNGPRIWLGIGFALTN